VTSRNHRSGFTLIEVIIAVVILSIVAAVTVPSWSTASDTSQALAAVRIVAADLEYAQSVAITYRKSVTVTFDVDDDSYTVKDASGFLTHPFRKDDFEVAMDDMSGTEEAEISAAEFGSPATATLVFDETGTPTAGGTVKIQAGNATHTITVSGATGRVTVGP
jgi:prepilin-type N-terminal cleavage/methylation domain-containing protein